jgi:hypothetical protein
MRARVEVAYGEIYAGLSLDKWYQILGEKDGCFLIKDDFGNGIYIFQYGCMYLDGGDWEVEY